MIRLENSACSQQLHRNYQYQKFLKHNVKYMNRSPTRPSKSIEPESSDKRPCCLTLEPMDRREQLHPGIHPTLELRMRPQWTSSWKLTSCRIQSCRVVGKLKMDSWSWKSQRMIGCYRITIWFADTFYPDSEVSFPPMRTVQFLWSTWRRNGTPRRMVDWSETNGPDPPETRSWKSLCGLDALDFASTLRGSLRSQRSSTWQETVSRRSTMMELSQLDLSHREVHDVEWSESLLRSQAEGIGELLSEQRMALWWQQECRTIPSTTSTVSPQLEEEFRWDTPCQSSTDCTRISRPWCLEWIAEHRVSNLDKIVSEFHLDHRVYAGLPALHCRHHHSIPPRKGISKRLRPSHLDQRMARTSWTYRENMGSWWSSQNLCMDFVTPHGHGLRKHLNVSWRLVMAESSNTH